MVALALLESLAPNADKLLISTFGNAQADDTGKNSKDFVSFMQNKWSYREGEKLPINQKIEHAWPTYFHGPDGLWNVRPPKKRQSAKQTGDFNHDTLISLAPNTETLKLISLSKPKKLVLMGGAFEEKGNETPYAEFNFAFDPDAAQKIFENCKNIDVYLVPLDVTRKVTWTLEKVQSIPETSEMNKWLRKLLLAWFENYDHDKEKDFNLHDPLAVYLAFYPESIGWITSGVEVITEGKQRGRTVLSKDNPVCNVALYIDEPKTISEKIFKTLFNS